MSNETANGPKRKISDENSPIKRNLLLDNTTPIRRSVMETGNTKVPAPDKLNRSFMSGKIRLVNSRPQSTISVIEEHKELDISETKKEIQKKEKDSDSVRKVKSVGERNTDMDLEKGDLGSGRFEKRMHTQRTSMYSSHNGNIGQQGYNNATPYQNVGVVNMGYVPSRPVSIGGGSIPSIPVYREQYCFYSKWSRLERMLLLIIFILCFIVVCLIATVGYLSQTEKLADGNRPGLFRLTGYQSIT